jgi:anti-sigma regulatory factor (Ser/Thr protein kinase)
MMITTCADSDTGPACQQFSDDSRSREKAAIRVVQPALSQFRRPWQPDNCLSGRTLVVGLPCEPAGVPRARKAATGFFARWDVPQSVCEDGELVVAELAGNAVRHTDGPIMRMRLACLPRQLVVVIADLGPRRRPIPACSGESWASNGRGLAIVGELSEQHGHVLDGLATTAWAVLAW